MKRWSCIALLLLAPSASPTITGMVTSASTEKPLPGAPVEVFEQLDPAAARLRHAAGEVMGEPLARGTTDGSGRFRLTVPMGRRLIVVAEAAGHQRSFLARPLVLTTTSERDLGRIELPTGRRLTGKVLDADGKPVAGARIIATVPRLRAQRGTGAGFARSFFGSNQTPPFPVAARTGADGAFTLDSLPDRPVTLRAWAARLATGLVENVRGATATVRLAPGVALTGKVVGPDGRTPAPGVQVFAGEQGWDGMVRSAADGTFRFDNLRKGPVSLTAIDEKSLYLAPSAPAPATPAVTLRLRPGGLVHARAIDSETRQPVAGAAITLNAPGEDEARPAVTGPDGDVTFTGVPVGGIRVRAIADGYLEAELDQTPLAAGQTRQWSAALRPAAAVEGTVRDATGRPVAGAQVSVSGPPPSSLPMRLPIFFPLGVDPVTTDAQGRFVLESLPPKDELKISVESDGFAPWEMAGITLRPAERRKGMEVLLEAGSMISGRLLNANGQPVAAAGVTASRRREGGPGGMVIRIEGRGRAGGPGGPGSDEELPPALSGPDGVFRVRGARPGIWSIEVGARGYAPKTVGGLKLEESSPALDTGDIVLEPGVRLTGRVVTSAGEPIAYARGSLRKDFSVLSTFNTGLDGVFVTEDLASGDTFTLAVDADGYAALEKRGITPPMEEMTITLVPASRVSGQVLDRETRRPIPDFSIAMSRERGGGGGGMTMRMSMAGPETPFHADDGMFVVEDVDPGKVVVEARAPGYKESAMRDLEVPEGSDLDGLVFTLDRAASVSGTVLDDKGRPLSAVVVEKNRTRGRGVPTDGDGRFILTGLDRGPMTLSFTHPDYEPAERDIDTARDVPDLRVTLSRGATLSGIVLHEEDGSPVGGATVSATAAGADRMGGGLRATTGPDGAFSIDAVPAGHYTLRAEAAGLRGAAVEGVDVAAGGAPPPIELRLGGGVHLTGRLTGVKESELPQFTVRAIAAGGSGGPGGFGTTAPVDAGGNFEMKGLAPGTITLIAGAGMFGGKSATRTVQIPENTATFETTIEFPSGARVEGQVTRGGKPVDGATVIFANDATRARATATADLAGRYRVEDLDDGEYSVDVVLFSAGLSHSTKTTVKGDRELDVELPLARITGTVQDAGTGRPLDGVEISIKKENSAQPAAGIGFMFQQGARTDATGSYSIDGLEDGTYTLTARKNGYGFKTRAVTIAPELQPDPIPFELALVDAFSFRAIDAASGSPLNRLTALVLVGGGDPLAPNGSGATTVFRDPISADATGLFHLDSLQPGVYRVVLGGQGIATETLNNVQVPRTELTLAMTTSRGSVEVIAGSLHQGQIARAVLVDLQGNPVHVNTYLAEPTILLRPGAPSTLTDVKPGAYRLRVAMPGGGITETSLDVVAGQITKLPI